MVVLYKYYNIIIIIIILFTTGDGVSRTGLAVCGLCFLLFLLL